jgi:hypothetical protein
MQTLIGGKDLLFIGRTFLIKSYTTDHYEREEQAILHADKAIPYVQGQLEQGKKVVIYKRKKRWDVPTQSYVGSGKWVKLLDTQIKR